jgi:hypothetical protein
MNNQQRRLRRRSPSETTCSSNVTETSQQKLKLHRSTTIEDITLDETNVSYLDVDTKEQKLEKVIGSPLRKQIGSSNSSLSSSSDSFSETDDSCMADDFVRTLPFGVEGDLYVEDDSYLSQSKSATCFLERSLTEEIERQLDEVDALVCSTGHENGIEHHVKKYHAKRMMTPTQEKWNALTMIPPVIYCVYYILSGQWIDPSFIQLAKETESDWLVKDSISSASLQYGCWNTSDSTILRNVPSPPPLPVTAVAVAVILHAPFSFLYHWKYAIRPNAILHWSRRMDQAMIHVASALLAYATSGNVKYFILTLLFNLDCCYKQLFYVEVRPRRNQTRIFLAILFYTLPLLRRDEIRLFTELWIVLLTSTWLFATYPFGGWSHALFHVVSYLVPPLLMVASLKLPACQQQVMFAAQCVVRSTTS